MRQQLVTMIEEEIARMKKDTAALEALLERGPRPGRTPRASNTPPIRRRRMSAAARKAISKRMKAYWAGRRK